MPDWVALASATTRAGVLHIHLAGQSLHGLIPPYAARVVLIEEQRNRVAVLHQEYCLHSVECGTHEAHDMRESCLRDLHHIKKPFNDDHAGTGAGLQGTMEIKEHRAFLERWRPVPEKRRRYALDDGRVVNPA